MGILANLLRNKASERVEQAMSAVKDTTDDLTRAVDRLDRIVRNNIETTVDRAFEENARLTGRKRRQ